jgi:hypothetical protein
MGYHEPTLRRHVHTMKTQLPKTPRRRGELIELLFAEKATSLGFHIFKPVCDESYDFILDSGRRLWRVQVKSTDRLRKGGYLIGACHFATHNTKQCYTPAEIDILAAYIVPEKAWYIIPVEAFTPQQWLSFYPQNKQSQGRFEPYREAWSLLK